MSCHVLSVKAMASTLPVVPLVMPEIGMEPCLSPISAIEARLVNPSAGAIVLNRVPPVVQTHQPLEIELVTAGPRPDTMEAASVAHCLSKHAHLSINVRAHDHSLNSELVQLSVRPTSEGWVARALVHPASWAGAAFVTVESLSLAGQPLPSELFPATLRMGYNHAAAPEGLVFFAGQAGDVRALQAALDAGGSTEEAESVRRKRGCWRTGHCAGNKK